MKFSLLSGALILALCGACGDDDSESAVDGGIASDANNTEEVDGGGEADAGENTPDAAVEDPIFARCSNHCDIEFEEECDEADREECITDCRANTSGLAFTCAACLIDNGTPLEDGILQCSGGSMPDLGVAACSEFCDDGASDVDEEDVSFRCENHCDVAYEDNCDEDDQGECLLDCRANVSGLAPACAACLIDNGRPLEDGVLQCNGGEMRNLGFDPCDIYCTN